MDEFKVLCPVYKVAFAEMKLAYDSITNRQQKLEILSEFAKRYTLPPMYWKQLLSFAKEFSINDEYQNWIHRALSQFLLPSHTTKVEEHLQWDNLEFIRKQILDFDTIENGLKMCERALKYPHNKLTGVYKLYTANLLKPLSKSVEQDYLDSLKLYKQFEAANKKPKKWLALLDTLEDKNVVIANMELCLSLNTNWSKKELWLKLIGILKETKSRHILNVYSRYTRLFISDAAIREEYRAAIEAFGALQQPVAEYWLDTILFECQFISEQSAHQLIQRILTSLVESSQISEEFQNFQFQGNSFEETFDLYKNLLLNIDHQHTVTLHQQVPYTVNTTKPRKIIHFQNPSNQALWLHNPVVRYILKTSKAKLLRKLFQTCKYFYAFQSTPICYHFLLSTNAANLSLKQESIFLSENDISNIAINNLYVSNVFTCISINRRILAEVVIQKIFKSDAEFYHIQNQDLYLDELQKLIPFQSARSLNLENCVIRYRNEAVMDNRAVLALFLKKVQK